MAACIDSRFIDAMIPAEAQLPASWRKSARRKLRIATIQRELRGRGIRISLQGWSCMTGNLRIALRKLAKSPGFVSTAIVTLALGIGANAVVFGVLNAVVLHPLNVPDSQSLVTVQRFKFPSHSYPDYVDLR